MAFAFNPEQREQLFTALGRSDSGASHLVEDVELALDAYGQAEKLAEERVVPAVEFERLLTQAGHLRAQLYALPERARQLAVIGGISIDDAADVSRLAQAAGEALEGLSVKLAEVAIPMASAPSGALNVAERFVHGVSKAFRNRLNIKPTVDARGLFRRFLSALINMVGRRHTDLDDLSHAMDDVRLAHILESD